MIYRRSDVRTSRNFHSGATLAKLQAGGLYESTVVIMHADHGYALGEHGMWEKKSNWCDRATPPPPRWLT
jgi:arylsulfatase A-like enzyme